MCVAVFKPAGAETPSLTILKECWERNSDGAGIAVSERQAVFYRKGFMKFSELEDFYYANNLQKRVGQAMVFHFRIGTHGHKDAGNTHPFRITDDPVLLRVLTGRVASVLAHNGIFRLEPKRPKISDTGQFIVDCVSESGGDPVAHWDKHPDIIGWSKLVMLYPENRFKLLGSWSLESSDSCGCLFSNMIWKPYVAPKGGYYHNSGYGGYCGSDIEDWRDRPATPAYENCKACGGTGLSSTGRVRCAACNGYGRVKVKEGKTKTRIISIDEAAKETPAAEPVRVITAEEGHQPALTAAEIACKAWGNGGSRTARVTAAGIKVWDAKKKDYVLLPAIKNT